MISGGHGTHASPTPGDGRERQQGGSADEGRSDGGVVQQQATEASAGPRPTPPLPPRPPRPGVAESMAKVMAPSASGSPRSIACR